MTLNISTTTFLCLCYSTSFLDSSFFLLCLRYFALCFVHLARLPACPYRAYHKIWWARGSGLAHISPTLSPRCPPHLSLSFVFASIMDGDLAPGFGEWTKKVRSQKLFIFL